MTREPSGERPLGRRRCVAGALLLAVAAASSGALAWQHLGLGQLPGCGLESPCERVTSGPWGTLPVLSWPVAFVGLAHFAALLVTWGLAGGAWPATLTATSRLGALASLAFLGRMLADGEACAYCLTAHAANLVFAAAVVRTSRRTETRRAELGYLSAFVLVSGGLAALRTVGERARTAAEEQDLVRSTEALRSSRSATPFTGRYLRGPATAAVRVVLFTDYQCPDCAAVEAQATELLGERSDLSLAVKHFPLCVECNVRARELGRNPHRNACWAARAAEAAGMLGGAEGFWRLHGWLFERRGAFDEATLRAALPGLGFEVGPFLALLRGAETLRRVEADVAEALDVGIDSTPLIFVNGVELRGWRARDGLRRGIEAAAAVTPDPARAGDRPQGALEKALEDWRLEPVQAPAAGRGIEAGGDAIDAVVFGDVLDDVTRDLERRLRALAAERPRVRLSFRHFPLDASCDPTLPDVHPGACLAAHAVEAARRVAGDEAAARAREWLTRAARAPDEAVLRAAASELELDPDAWCAALASPDVHAVVAEDLAEARRLDVHAIPQLFVAGKRVPRWRVGELPVLERILDEALAAR